MKSINIGWKETHFIKIQICTPWILDEKNTFYQNIHLYTINIGWNETHFIKIHFCIHQYWMKSINIGWKASILDEKKHILSKYKFVHLQHWMKGNTFYQNTLLYPINIGWKASILDEKHQYSMKSIDIGWRETHFIKIQICTPILDEKNTFYQNIHLFTFNIGWKETHFYQNTQLHAFNIASKETYFIKIPICILSILDEKHQYWMKHILSKYKFVLQYWMKRNTFYQNTHLYSNIGWKEHILSKYTFVHHQHWMKGNTFYRNMHLYTINIGWKETHFYQDTQSRAFNIGWNETFYQNTLLYPINIGWKASILDEKKHILLKYKFVHLEYWWKEHILSKYICTPSTLDERNTFYQNTLLYPIINIGWKPSILDEKKHILSKYKFVHLQHWMKGNTFYQNTLLYPINIGWKASILDEKHQYWMKSIDIGWRETHFIKIQICTPILDEKNTFYQNIHLFTFNIGWKETHFYQNTQLHAFNIASKETYFIKIPICINIGWKASILDEKKHILSKYKFVLQYWMKRTHFIKIYICTPILDEKNTFYQNIHLYMKMNTFYQNIHFCMHLYTINIGWKETHFYQDTQSRAFNIGWNETFYQNTLLYPINIGWKASILDEKKHILSKYKFVHLEYWMKRTHFIKIYICTPSTLDEMNTFYQNTLLDPINIGWKPSILDEKKHILSKYKFVLQYWKKRTHFIKIYISTPSTLDERKHILSKYTFVSHQYWMKSINIGWKETHFIKIQICTPWILDEKNTFYQNIHLYTINIGWNETHFIKIHFCILSILDEKHKYWMKSINIGWKASILDEKKHILSKYKFVHLQHWMKGNTFYQNTHQYWMKSINIGWKASILDEKHQYWMKRNTFYQNTNLYSNIGWKEHILSKYTFVHLQHWMKGNTFLSKYTIVPSILDEMNTFYQNTLLYPSILDEKHQYWMKSINIGWKETHFIKI